MLRIGVQTQCGDAEIGVKNVAPLNDQAFFAIQAVGRGKAFALNSEF